MARSKKTMIVEDFPPRREGIGYCVQVASARADRRASVIHVTLVHTDGGQDGRRESITLPLPVRPEGLAAQFFRACGQRCEIGAEVDETSSVGRALIVSFRSSADGMIVCEFQAIGGDYEPASAPR